MDTARYDNGISYEALQEVLMQTIAYLTSTKGLHANSDIEKTISQLVAYKQALNINEKIYNEALTYMTQVRMQCGLA